MAKRHDPIGDIAAEVGRLFGTTEGHARKWLSQRQELLKALSAVKERATVLIAELSAAPVARAGRRGAVRGEGENLPQPGERMNRRGRRKGFKLAAATRAKMKAAWKKRKAGGK